MEARLTLIEHGRRTAVFDLAADPLVIGRDPSANLVLDFQRVSRRHAMIRSLGERHTLSDLGSSNGSVVNGARVEGTVLLQPGDVIELGEEATLVYEVGEELRGTPAAVWIGLLSLLILVTAAATWLWTRPPEIDAEALRLAEAGLAASRAGDAVTAKQQLQAAAGILYHEGHLDDVPRAEVMREAMARLGAALPEEVDLWSIFGQALEASRPRARAAQEKPTGCRLDRVGARDLQGCLRERIELIMVELWQDPSQVPPEFHLQVGARLRRENEFIARALQRGRAVVPKLRRAFEAEKMPPLLHYLALIESGYRTDAVSPAKAVGMWQFMPGTARQFGLKVGGRGDERRDVDKSTRAAVRYLKGLAFEFGGDALLLALAGYNRGENGVRRALKKLDNPFVDRSYWRLVEEDLLPGETANYVPRFMAAAVAGEAGLPDPETLARAGY